MSFRRSVVAVVFLAAGVAGCMKNGIERVARYQPGAGDQRSVVGVATASSAYKVKYADVARGELKTVRGSRRELDYGDCLGFRTADDGTLLAVAGAEVFPLDVPADRVHHVVWCRRVKKPRQFFVETGRVAQGTLEGAGYVAGKFAEAGLNAALHTDDDDDGDCDDDAGPWDWGGGGDHDHHSHHGGGSGGGGNHGGGSHGGGGGGHGGGGGTGGRIGARNP
jgi:uncharacterized membrane protein YgcG